jgi:septum formation protein
VRRLILASGSPRRREILTRLGLSFEVLVTDIDESQQPQESPELYVARLAESKARAALPAARDALAVLGADTTVVIDHELLGKPSDLADSERMLRLLRGREHAVHTAVALLLWPEAEARVVGVTTRVRFRDFSDATLRRYVASREGMDKAGSYGIQELGQALVAEIHGSYSNVVGLPAAETIELLETAGVLAGWP